MEEKYTCKKRNHEKTTRWCSNCNILVLSETKCVRVQQPEVMLDASPEVMQGRGDLVRCGLDWPLEFWQS